ncbi:hypothetical protein NXS08_00575 [Gleimia sp. 6138-11-ORH1]|uniref:hypothetical protein n=1 Tax=Gleimia sp. 6138-11-ORH1 TaxID=2973937 RepID=UPI0021688ADC|nr:hypothetical protein [Gleimia sp. 6138-11-ORH1]MCS4483987.1 hypothetical protein [Gleimia sp. 6138-11-ORH1]
MVEFIMLATVVLVPLAYLILTLASLQAAVFASEASARDAAYILSHDLTAENLAIEQLDANFSSYLREEQGTGKLSYRCDPMPCAVGSLLLVRVETAVPLPLIPGDFAQTLGAELPVVAEYAFPVEGLVIRHE